MAISADCRGFVGNLGRWPRICWHSWQLVQDFSANGQEFVSILGRPSGILGKIVSILGRWSRFCQRMAKHFLAFWADCPAGLSDDHIKDLLACLRSFQEFVTEPFQSADVRSIMSANTSNFW